MSFVVMGMEMPKDCIVCYDTTMCFGTGRYFEDGTIRCGLAKGYIGLKDTSKKCPLVELPEKHGRLIDANALVGKFEPKQAYFTEAIINKLSLAPVIVEAEG